MLSQEEKDWINQHRSVSGKVNKDFSLGAEVSADFDPEKIRSVFLRSLPVVVVIILFAGVAAWLYLRYTPPLYESSSLLKLDVKKESNIFGFGGLEAYSDPGSNLAGELELIQSNVIYDQVAQNPNLKVSYFYQGKILSEEKYKSSPYALKIDEIKSELLDKNINVELDADSNFILNYTAPSGKEISLKGKLNTRIETEELKAYIYGTAHMADGQVPGTFFFRVNSFPALINYLASSLQATVVNPNARTIRVSFTDFNKFKAKDIVDAIDSVYLLETVNSKNQAANQTIEFLNYQLSITDDSQMIAEQRIERFIRENKQLNSDKGLENTIDQISSLETEQFSLKSDLQGLENFKNSITSKESEADFISDVSFFGNPSLQKFIEDYNQQRIKYNRIAISRKENTMALQAVKKRLESLESNLMRLIDKELLTLKRKINTIQQRINQYERELQDLPQLEAEYTRLKRHSDLYEKFYLLMMDRKAQYGINKSGTIPDFRILSQAAIADFPVSPRRGLVYGGALAAGFGVSLLYLVITYLLSNRVTSQNEVERLITSPILGSVPQYVRGKMEFSKLVIGENPKSQISEAFRSIRTNMDFIVQKRR
jgi:tyrosine-protein kinase Etk/Wzc